ncbi:hypothetical protein [Martelella endophytica]|nr:hypothetical protein [Martelella endophytica]
MAIACAASNQRTGSWALPVAVAAMGVGAAALRPGPFSRDIQGRQIFSISGFRAEGRGRVHDAQRIGTDFVLVSISLEEGSARPVADAWKSANVRSGEPRRGHTT